MTHVLAGCSHHQQRDITRITTQHHNTGSRAPRISALRTIKHAAGAFTNLPWNARALTADLNYAEELIAAAATSDSWTRNAAGVKKFR